MSKCPEATQHSGLTDKAGRCLYCGAKVEAAQTAPQGDPSIKSELRLAYEYHWDPDYGTDRRDKY